MKADRAKTIEQQYLDPKSFMRPDGSEVLKREDWIARKKQLWERCGGRCEYAEADWRCNREGQIPAHVIPRYPRRNDNLENLRCYCVEHDRLTERQSWRKTRFGEKAA